MLFSLLSFIAWKCKYKMLNCTNSVPLAFTAICRNKGIRFWDHLLCPKVGSRNYKVILGSIGIFFKACKCQVLVFELLDHLWLHYLDTSQGQHYLRSVLSHMCNAEQSSLPHWHSLFVNIRALSEVKPQDPCITFWFQKMPYISKRFGNH